MLNVRQSIHENSGFLVCLLVLGLVRTAVADYNPVPSGSMHPTILEGDVVLVNRLAYDIKIPLTDSVLARLDDPKRGDIVTFSSPKDGVRLIKRVIGLPGDVVAMRDKQLTVNGASVEYTEADMGSEAIGNGVIVPVERVKEALGEHTYQVQWMKGVRSVSSFAPVTIPPDQYLMLGDNRDNSADSRFIGLVQRERLIGRAERVLVSADILTDWSPRLNRFGKSLSE